MTLRSFIFVFTIVPMLHVSAQLVSPGKLSVMHQQLEGVNNCTKCHNFGASTFRDNCLACHTEIKSRVEKGLGYHYNTRKLECSKCHKEHHGRDFELVRWDPKKFDHRQAGFELNGKHEGKDCRQCHAVKNIVEKMILKKSSAAKQKTFLGLEPVCGSCHDDEHRGQLNKECDECHTTENWKKNSFSHTKARFKLEGKHEHVDCQKCHPKVNDGKTIAGDQVFLKFKTLAYKSCLDCHEDQHKGSFGKDCAGCHSPAGWKQVRISTANFDHSKTQYPLEGKHGKVQCTQCHVGGDFKRFKEKDLTTCLTCHGDYHMGQFSQKTDKGDCKRCHTIEGFFPSKYEPGDHKNARFQLSGAHIAIPCNRCHVKITIEKNKTQQFLWESFACTSCHDDRHAGQFDERIRTGGCQSCHVVDSWHSMEFDHATTTFPLLGKHIATPCEKCHKAGELQSVRTTIYKIQSTACESCHNDIHQGQLKNVSGLTACQQCHSPFNWKNVSFDHNAMSKFQLSGKHRSAQCTACHKKERITPDGEPTLRFKPLETKCSSCHKEIKD